MIAGQVLVDHVHWGSVCCRQNQTLCRESELLKLAYKVELESCWALGVTCGSFCTELRVFQWAIVL